MGQVASSCRHVCCRKSRKNKKTVELDSLSPSKLSADREHLQKLVSEKGDQSDLASQLSDLDGLLSQSLGSKDCDVHEAAERFQRKVEEMKNKLEAKEKNFQIKLQEVSQQLSQQVTDHRRIVEEMRQENRKKIEDLEAKHEGNIIQLRDDVSEEREEIEKEVLQLRAKMDEKVNEKLEEMIQPYLSSYEESKSLQTVLEMKNKENQKLQQKISQEGDNMERVRVLSDQVISLQQKNEDLQAQVDEKNAEHRNLKAELEKFRQNLEEQNRFCTTQQQRIEELSYRINTNSPSPLSPFNPVFTQTPGSTNGDADSVWPSIRNKQYHAENESEEIQTQRKLIDEDSSFVALKNGV